MQHEGLLSLSEIILTRIERFFARKNVGYSIRVIKNKAKNILLSFKIFFFVPLSAVLWMTHGKIV